MGLAKSPGKFFLGYMTPVRGRKKQALALIRLLGKCKSQLPAFNATPGGNLRAQEKQHPWPFFVRVLFKEKAVFQYNLKILVSQTGPYSPFSGEPWGHLKPQYSNLPFYFTPEDAGRWTSKARAIGREWSRSILSQVERGYKLSSARKKRQGARERARLLSLL